MAFQAKSQPCFECVSVVLLVEIEMQRTLARLPLRKSRPADCLIASAAHLAE